MVLKRKMPLATGYWPMAAQSCRSDLSFPIFLDIGSAELEAFEARGQRPEARGQYVVRGTSLSVIPPRALLNCDTLSETALSKGGADMITISIDSGAPADSMSVSFAL
jgi:hypothetical protein